ADRKFIAAVGTMTVGLRQTKKFLAGHKPLLTLRARDIFKISHSSSIQIGVWSGGVLSVGLFLNPLFHHSSTPLLRSPSPPRLDRDLFPSFFADDFQWIDARQYFVRNSQPFGKRFAHRLGAVKTGLRGYVAFGRTRIEGRSIHSGEQH